MPVVRSQPETGSFVDLRAALEIDKNSLDDDLVQQPDLFYRVSEKYTEARSLLDEIKGDITQAESSLGAQFRAEAEGARDKITVDGLKQMIAGTPRMVKLQKELLDASTQLGKWAALKEAYDMRASALKSLVQLYASNYFTVATGSVQRSAAVRGEAESIRKELGEGRRERPVRVRPRSDD